MRKLLALLTALAVALVLAACTPEEADTVKAVNDFRTANGVPTLTWEDGAYDKAHAWAEHLADIGHLEHSKLSDGVNAPWSRLGENVAYAGSLDGAMRALESSAPHRANLLNRGFDRFAVGVAVRNGTYWVTEVFLG
jgi:uncharacterized protein YkwD